VAYPVVRFTDWSGFFYRSSGIFGIIRHDPVADHFFNIARIDFKSNICALPAGAAGW
jgi:hypothetical protein